MLDHRPEIPGMSPFEGRIEAAPKGALTPLRSLTHSLDLGKEGIAMQATRDASNMTPAQVARFWSHVAKSDGCWEWTAAISHGYGRTQYRRDGDRFQWQAHRLAWVLLNGPVPDDLPLDHLCRNRRCVNPEHLEPVTNRINLLRGETMTAKWAKRTHCNYGHPFSGSNLGIKVDGSRRCNQCHRDAQARYFHRRQLREAGK